jgi:hypothetical protein
MSKAFLPCPGEALGERARGAGAGRLYGGRRRFKRDLRQFFPGGVTTRHQKTRDPHVYGQLRPVHVAVAVKVNVKVNGNVNVYGTATSSST